MSVLVCVALVWMHLVERRTLAGALEDLGNIRQARIDLSKGFLHVCLAGYPDSPFSLEEGMALLGQSIDSLDRSRESLERVGRDSQEGFKESVAAFQDELRALRALGVPEPAQMVGLRVTFRELERQADRVDKLTHAHLVEHARHLDVQFFAALGVAVLLLGVICAVVVHAGQTKDRFEESSKENADRLREAMEATRDGLWDWDVGTGKVYYSPAYWRMLGYPDTAGEKGFQSWVELLHPEERERVMAACMACVEGRCPSFEIEYRLKACDGSWRWILGRGKAAERDASGRALRMVGTHVDITERVRAEEALRASEEQSRAIFQVVSVGIVQVDPREGRIVRFNGKYCEITGYPAEELYHVRFSELTHPDDREEDWKLFDRAVKDQSRSYNNEKRYVRKDGSVVWVRLSASFIRDESGRPVRSVAVCEDITERKNAEEEREQLQEQLLQAQKMESIGRLAGGVAHDFNNMLSVILGHAELALESDFSRGEVVHALEQMRGAALRASDLTRQLLAFARRQTIKPQVLDLNEAVGKMLKMLERMIGEDIDLAWRQGEALWKVELDPSQVDQLLANLCVNARDAIADTGKVTIETDNAVFDEAYCKDHVGFVPGEYVLLAVSDNGCGMDKETQAKIFEPFFTTKGVGQGTGLGLATVYGIVKQNNGFINVYSEPGKGTTFRIYLHRYAGTCEAAPVEEAATCPPKGRGEMILAVEDDPALLELTASMLAAEGYGVLPALGPQEALRVAEGYEGEIPLLMTDVVMPEMNGRELEARLRVSRPSIRCLFTSGYTANVIAHHGVLDAAV